MTQQEIESMVVRLMGDAGHYQKVLDDAVRSTSEAVKQFEENAKEADAQRKLLEAAAKAESAAVADAARIAASVRTPIESYKTALQNLDSHVAAGRLSQEDYERAVNKLGQTLPQVQQSNKAAAEAQNYLNQQMIRGQQITRSLETSTQSYEREVAELNTLLKVGAIDQQTFNRALEQTKNRLLPNIDGVQQLGSSLTHTGAVLTGVGAAIGGVFGGTAVKGMFSAGQFEQTNIAFETMIGSVEETQNTLADLTEFAALTPFEMPEIEQAARGLIQFGERGDELMETLNLLGNAAAGTSTDFGMISLIFNQIRGVGKLLTQDFRQLSTRGVLSLQDIADHFKVTTNAAQEMLSKGEISFDDVKDIFRNLSAEGGRFANLMERQSTSFLGLKSTLSDAINIMVRGIGQEMLPIAKAWTSGLIEIVNWISKMSGGTKTAIAVVLGLGSAFGVTITAIGTTGIVIGQLISGYGSLMTVIRAVTASQMALNVAWGGAFVGAAAIAIYAGYKLGEDIAYISEETRKAANMASSLRKEFEELSKVDFEGVGVDATQEFMDKTAESIKKLEAQNKELQNTQSWWNFYQRNADTIGTNNVALDGLNKRLNDASKHLQKMKEEAAIESGAVVDPKLIESVEEFTQKLKAQADTVGMESDAAKLALFERQGVPKSYLDAAAAALKMKDAAEQVWKGQEEERKALQKLKDDLAGFENTLKEQIATFGMTSREVELYKLQQRGLGEEVLGPVTALSEQMDALERTNKAMDKGRQMIEQFLTPEEKFLKTTKELAQLKDIGAFKDSPETFTRAMKAAEEELLKAQENGNVEVEFEVKGLDVIRAGTQEYQKLVNDTLKFLDRQNKPVNLPLIPEQPQEAEDAFRKKQREAEEFYKANPMASASDFEKIEDALAGTHIAPGIKGAGGDGASLAVGDSQVFEYGPDGVVPVDKPVSVRAGMGSPESLQDLMKRVAEATEAQAKRDVIEVKPLGLRST